MLASFKLTDRLKTVILFPDFIPGNSGNCPSPKVIHTTLRSLVLCFEMASWRLGWP